MHVGLRGPIYAASDLTDDAELGFRQACWWLRAAANPVRLT